MAITARYRDQFSSAFAASVGASAPAFTAYRDTYCYLPTPTHTADKIFSFYVPLNHDYLAGSELYLHIHWIQLGTDDAKTCSLRGKYHKAVLGTAVGADASWTVISVDLTLTAANQYKPQVTALCTINGSTLVAGAGILGYLARDVSEESGTGDVAVLQIEPHYATAGYSLDVGTPSY